MRKMVLQCQYGMITSEVWPWPSKATQMSLSFFGSAWHPDAIREKVFDLGGIVHEQTIRRKGPDWWKATIYRYYYEVN